MSSLFACGTPYRLELVPLSDSMVARLTPSRRRGLLRSGRVHCAGACGWALNEGFKSGAISLRESEMTKWLPDVPAINWIVELGAFMKMMCEPKKGSGTNSAKHPKGRWRLLVSDPFFG